MCVCVDMNHVSIDRPMCSFFSAQKEMSSFITEYVSEYDCKMVGDLLLFLEAAMRFIPHGYEEQNK